MRGCVADGKDRARRHSINAETPPENAVQVIPDENHPTRCVDRHAHGGGRVDLDVSGDWGPGRVENPREGPVAPRAFASPPDDEMSVRGHACAAGALES